MNRLIAALDRACPGFEPDPDDGGSNYGWVAGFVGHVSAAHRAGRTDEVKAVFAVIEQTVANNGADAELAIIGFLEDMQNGNLHVEGTRPQDFAPYLGPHSAKNWQALNGFWQGVEAARGKRS